jgi:hypothetical protein
MSGGVGVRRQVFTRRLGIFLGLVFVVFGVLETIRVFASGDGGLLFWFGTLCGGGALILLSTLRLKSRPGLSLAALIVGVLAACVATVWTVVLPVLALLLMVLRMTERSEAPTADPVR